MIFDINQEKILLEKNGEKVECDILFSFDSKDTGKSYIGYTDDSIASNGRKNIYVSSIDLSKNQLQLDDVTDKNELNMIYDVLQQLDSSANS